MFPDFIDSDSCKIDSNTDSKFPLQRFQRSKCETAKTNWKFENYFVRVFKAIDWNKNFVDRILLNLILSGGDKQDKQ